jgi:hypothetical protein
MALSSNNISFLSFGKTTVGGKGYTIHIHSAQPYTVAPGAEFLI